MRQIEQAIEQGLERCHAESEPIHLGPGQDQQEKENRGHETVGQAIIGRSQPGAKRIAVS